MRAFEINFYKINLAYLFVIRIFLFIRDFALTARILKFRVPRKPDN